jgi:hypothetical protein
MRTTIIQSVSAILKTVLGVFSFIGLISCSIESELEIDNYPIQPRLVLNGIIYAVNDTNRLYFSKSYALFDPEYARNPIKNEYWDGWHPDRKVYLLPDVRSTIYKNDVLCPDVFVNPDDSITYYPDKTVAGDHIRIEAKHAGNSISAFTTIPLQPIIAGVDTLSNHLLIHIKSHPNTSNYYRIFAGKITETQIDPEYAKITDLPEIIVSEQNVIDSDDPIITNGNPKNDQGSDDFSISEFEQNYLFIFDDKRFINNEYVLNLFLNEQNSYWNPNNPYSNVPEQFILSKRIKVYVRLQALSEELYYYFSSFQKMIQLGSDFVEPIRIYNNIEGGLGILGAVNELEYIVMDKELPNP